MRLNKSKFAQRVLTCILDQCFAINKLPFPPTAATRHDLFGRTHSVATPSWVPFITHTRSFSLSFPPHSLWIDLDCRGLFAVAHWSYTKSTTNVSDDAQYRWHFLGGKSYNAVLGTLTLFTTIFSAVTIAGVPYEVRCSRSPPPPPPRSLSRHSVVDLTCIQQTEPLTTVSHPSISIQASVTGFFAMRWLTSGIWIGVGALCFIPRYYRIMGTREYDCPNDFVSDRFNNRILSLATSLIAAGSVFLYIIIQLYGEISGLSAKFLVVVCLRACVPRIAHTVASSIRSSLTRRALSLFPTLAAIADLMPALSKVSDGTEVFDRQTTTWILYGTHPPAPLSPCHAVHMRSLLTKHLISFLALAQGFGDYRVRVARRIRRCHLDRSAPVDHSSRGLHQRPRHIRLLLRGPCRRRRCVRLRLPKLLCHGLHPARVCRVWVAVRS